MTEPCYRGTDSATPTAPTAPADRMVGHRRGQERADENLIRSLYQEHGGCLLAYATRLLGGDRAAAEDIVQEVLLRAWRRSDALVNGRGSVRSWLLTVTRNVVIDRIRARAARPRELVGLPHQHPVERDHGDMVADSMTVVAALGRLSPDHREVLVEVYYHGHSVAEAAERLGLPPGTVKSRTFYALRALRQILAEPAATTPGPKLTGAVQPGPAGAVASRGPAAEPVSLPVTEAAPAPVAEPMPGRSRRAVPVAASRGGPRAAGSSLQAAPPSRGGARIVLRSA